MGWKGTFRSINAAIREAEREEKKRQRNIERQRKEYEKMEALERAKLEVDEYENFIECLVTIHQDNISKIDWESIASSSSPQKPDRTCKAEKIAQLAVDHYKPSLFDRLFNRQEKKHAKLNAAVTDAVTKDETNYQNALTKYNKEFQKWQESTVLAKRVLQRDPEAFLEAIREINPFSEISQLGNRIEFSVEENQIIQAILHVHGDKVVPKNSKSLLSSGRMSKKQLPKGRYFEIYQDHVCSSVLRVACDLFAILPIESVIVTAKDNILNTKTGHLEELAILSVAIPRKTIQALNLKLIDPSDSMQNFIHRMEFQKTKGFMSVEPLKSDEIPFSNMK